MPSTARMSRYRNLSQRQRVFVVTGALILAYLWILPFTADLNGEEGPSLFALIGRLHIVVLHLPIAWLVLVPLLEYIALRRQSKNMGEHGRPDSVACRSVGSHCSNVGLFSRRSRWICGRPGQESYVVWYNDGQCCSRGPAPEGVAQDPCPAKICLRKRCSLSRLRL